MSEELAETASQVLEKNPRSLTLRLASTAAAQADTLMLEVGLLQHILGGKQRRRNKTCPFLINKHFALFLAVLYNKLKHMVLVYDEMLKDVR